MPVDPDVLTKTLSMLASTLSIASSVTKLRDSGLSMKAAIDRFRSGASMEDKGLLDDPDVIQSVAAMTVIPEELLRQLEKEARACVVRHVDARDKATSDTDLDRANINAGQCVCRVLRDARRYNGGVLPGPLFDKLWISYECNL